MAVEEATIAMSTRYEGQDRMNACSASLNTEQQNLKEPKRRPISQSTVTAFAQTLPEQCYHLIVLVQILSTLATESYNSLVLSLRLRRHSKI